MKEEIIKILEEYSVRTLDTDDCVFETDFEMVADDILEFIKNKE